MRPALLLLLVPLALGGPAAGARADDPRSPRRLLFVHVSEYLYLNPLTHAAPGGADRTREAADRLARGFRVPAAPQNDQLFVLSDTASEDAPLPTRATVAKAVADFCATTREQDRVVLYFGAHALEADGRAYLVPLDGDPGAPDTLLPVADVYAALAKLKAAQKVVIWDVCRTNPERPQARRDPGPMTPELLKALTAVPEGVQALVGCSAGETGLEYLAPRGPAGLYAGSAYLDALRQAGTDHLVRNPKAPLGEPIPVAAFHRDATKFLAEIAKQTPALAGSEPGAAAPFDPKAEFAKRFEFAAPPKGAPAADVRAVLDELALPPLFDDAPGAPGRLPFAADALAPYAPDVPLAEVEANPQKYPVRAATLRALRTAREHWPLGRKETKAVTLVGAPVGERTKRAVAEAQLPLAQALARLELELEQLDALEAKAAAEPKRWRAHYEFVRAELRLRAVVLSEYNLALAHVRTEALPDLPPGAPGWRLVAAPKVAGRRETKELYAAAAGALERVAAEHRGTPWEVLARRSRAALPGYRWEPVPAAKAGR